MPRGETRLRGGWMQQVVRIGDTVRRAPRGDVAFIRALLGHLETAGFADAPRWLGTDDKGRDILSFVEGEVPARLGYFDDATLAAAARLIRRYHDATAALCSDGRVACHNDLNPCNFAFRGGVPAALFDFDNAAEGERIFDLGWAAWTWLNVGNDRRSPPEEQVRRLAVFATAYGPEVELGPLLDAMLLRQQLLGEARLPWRLWLLGAWARKSRAATLRLKNAFTPAPPTP